MKKALSLTLAASMAVGLAACGGSNGNNGNTGDSSTGGNSTSGNDTIVIGVIANFEEKWNPVMVESGYDMQVMDQIFVAPQRVNFDNEMEDWGGSIRLEENEDGTVTYTVKVKEGMKFSDGEDVTIDDYLYTIYLCSDPSYTGPASLANEDIKGMKEYYYDTEDYAAIEAQVEAYVPTAEEIKPVAERWAKENAMTVEDFMPETNEENYNEYILPELKAAYKQKVIKEGMSSGVKIPEIEGVKRVDDYTATITYNQLSIIGDRAINVPYVPVHYYGEFEKGNVSAQEKNMEPMGSGPYKWVSFSDNIVSLTANNDYFEGQPKTANVKFQYIPPTDTVAELAAGRIDIGNPNSDQETLDEMDAGGNMSYELVPSAGYGYMGLNADNLSKEVRQGVFYLMNRKPAVQGYFGDLAQVIERPMTTTLAEYPQDATEVYGYNPQKALEKFQEAGYTQQGGKLVNANGEQLKVVAYLGGSGTGDHPAAAMLTQAANAMKEMGGELQIQDVDFNVLQAAMNDGSADLWCMAWGAVTNCDKTQQFSSTGAQNRYRLKDEKMDAMLKEIVQTADTEARKPLVSAMLDYAMEVAVELPLYQRENVWGYNTDNLNMDTIQKSSASWDYTKFLWQIEMN